MSRLKIVTVVGTRPEIIRLSRVISALETSTQHTLVHTGQNYDYTLNEIFFRDLSLRGPDHYLNADTSSLGAMLGDVLKGTERVLDAVDPDAMVVLGDTNSCISALMARRMKIPVYHLEAGNRAFDANIPEEINRHLVDHVADYNLVYTEHSRRNLLAEGIHPSRIALIGSPMKEVLIHYREEIDNSDALQRLGLGPQSYILASIHREENVDDPNRLRQVIASLGAVSTDQNAPVLLSTHPRTFKRLERYRIQIPSSVQIHEPLGFHDYVSLQMHAKCVLSDSGTVSEESAILGFPAVTMRDAIERPEAIDSAGIVASGVNPDDVLDAVRIVLAQFASSGAPAAPQEYTITNTSRRVLNFIRSTAKVHHVRSGIRTYSRTTGGDY